MRLPTPGVHFLKVASIVIIAGVFLLNCSWAVRNNYSRDENMFVAGANLFSGSSLQPYQDFQYLHPPNQLLVYRALFALTGYDLLAGRIFSAACAAGIAALVLWMVKRFFAGSPEPRGYLFAWLSVLLLVANPLYIFVGGYLWDYNLAALCALASLALIFKALPSRRIGWWLAGAGLAYGLAMGTRINYVTGLAAIYGFLLLYPLKGSWIARAKLAGVFSLGLAAGLLPTLYYLVKSPEGFWFGNFTYHLLNTAFRMDSNYEGPIAMGERISYFWTSVAAQPGNLVLLIGVVFLGYLTLVSVLKRNPNSDPEAWLLLVLVPAVGLGAFISSPVWYQYYYAPVPFAVCLGACGLAYLNRQAGETPRRMAQLFILLVLLANLYQLQEYRRMTFLLHPEAWRLLQLHQAGETIRQAVGEGRVLTFAPELVMEAGLQIYPEFATGPFIWRVAPHAEPALREKLNLVGPGQLEAFLAEDPPAGILVGIEPGYEAPFIEYAQRNGYRRVEITSSMAVWVIGNE